MFIVLMKNVLLYDYRKSTKSVTDAAGARRGSMNSPTLGI